MSVICYDALSSVLLRDLYGDEEEEQRDICAACARLTLDPINP